MGIKIQTQDTVIPVEIGELKFSFDTSDASIKKFHEAALVFAKEIETVSENDEGAVETILRKAYDFVLGDGAYEKVYEKTPSTVRVLNILNQLIVAITAELTAIGQGVSQEERAQQYLRKNNRNQRRRHNNNKPK